AFVQPIDGTAPAESELLDRCRAQLAAYKVPESVTFVDGFDRTPMGKIRKTSLRSRGGPTCASDT
ncbi:MAG: hypothetical protein AAGK32_08805, partial [Actinomycetota bacterium]